MRLALLRLLRLLLLLPGRLGVGQRRLVSVGVRARVRVRVRGRGRGRVRVRVIVRIRVCWRAPPAPPPTCSSW